jgi:transcriptional regulator with XRE-family HTH domain
MRAFDAELGKRLAQVRVQLDVRAKDLAAAAGITSGALYNYEAGRTSCPPAMLAAFADHLGISVALLVPKHTSCGLLEDFREKSLRLS